MDIVRWMRESKLISCSRSFPRGLWVSFSIRSTDLLHGLMCRLVGIERFVDFGRGLFRSEDWVKVSFPIKKIIFLIYGLDNIFSGLFIKSYNFVIVISFLAITVKDSIESNSFIGS